MNSLTFVRTISTSCARLGKRNFRKFQMSNRGSIHDKMNPGPEEYVGARMPTMEGSSEIIPEMIPELVVPDLEGFKLKPYVSYNVPEVNQSEFTAENLFEAMYTEKIEADFKAGKLDEHGNSLEPSEDEMLGYEEAKARAQRTGADYFNRFWDDKRIL
ncbi:39S ribosomal protein L41, mitochondrial [Galendromus occidentalis]|uniref:39S ribosomal protein L41, mitochondrial n=1 Tax=Galendromus occidentalis TaxID=34638 RepID=A0AAJ6VZL5_9ACAR|nr:39S ribosomal protein L41, mitochondrial [Galendromus occidentalis]